MYNGVCIGIKTIECVRHSATCLLLLMLVRQKLILSCKKGSRSREFDSQKWRMFLLVSLVLLPALQLCYKVIEVLELSNNFI